MHTNNEVVNDSDPASRRKETQIIKTELQEFKIDSPEQKITDPSKLAAHRRSRRKEFEDEVGRARWNSSVWVKYAEWEESQKDLKRARSVWERGLEVDYRDHSMWLKYAEFEMKNGSMNHARNLFDRAIKLLPRVDQLWYNYIHMEEMLDNVAKARQIFNWWMDWHPDRQGWLSYIKFELRHNEVERARAIFKRFLLAHPIISSWIMYAKFEMKYGELPLVRNCFERAAEILADDEEAEKLFVAFAEFEEKCKEVERARHVYKFALDRIPRFRAEALYRKFVAFENQYGHKEDIENAIMGKRRFQYEDEVSKNPLDYDAWFDYIRLEESVGNNKWLREVYERALANVPPLAKRYWLRYIYLWIKYALYEELIAKDMDRTRDVYKKCLALIPHDIFSFAKIWLLAAQFEIRQLDIQGARKILGQAIGTAPKDKIFQRYINIEFHLGNIDHCRKLYEKYLEWSPGNCYAWRKYAELEIMFHETERARAIFELAVKQRALDMPELLWKAYVNFEISSLDNEETRALYERLLVRTNNHPKVWSSYIQFEAFAMDADSQDLENYVLEWLKCKQKGKEIVDTQVVEKYVLERMKCRQRAEALLVRAIMSYRTTSPELKKEWVMLLEEYNANIESHFENSEYVMSSAYEKDKRPQFKHRLPPKPEDGPAWFEEYIRIPFPTNSRS